MHGEVVLQGAVDRGRGRRRRRRPTCRRSPPTSCCSGAARTPPSTMPGGRARAAGRRRRRPRRRRSCCGRWCSPTSSGCTRAARGRRRADERADGAAGAGRADGDGGAGAPDALPAWSSSCSARSTGSAACGSAADELDEAVHAPLARACFVLAREFGWTPEECAALTVGQVLLYLEMLGSGDPAGLMSGDGIAGAAALGSGGSPGSAAQERAARLAASCARCSTIRSPA